VVDDAPHVADLKHGRCNRGARGRGGQEAGEKKPAHAGPFGPFVSGTLAGPAKL
jgi:hypothetical protein